MMRLVVALLSLLGLSAAGDIVPTNLLVEHLPSPLGVAGLAPRFSWHLSPSTPAGAQLRNVSQSAFQILVASSLGALQGNVADIWDSGQIPSAASTLVRFNGTDPLIAGQVYFWAVRVWTLTSGAASPQVSNYSAPSRFSLGFQSRADWSPSASFIGMGSASNSECPWFRKTFSLSAEEVAAIGAGQASALLHVASVGFHEAYVNGARLRNASVLVPSVSYLASRVFSHTYDISEAANLVVGTNVIGLWLAPGWALFEGVNPVMNFNISKAPLVLAELRIQPSAIASRAAAGIAHSPEGSVVARSVASDSSWKCSLSSTSHLGSWTNGNFGGDHLDYTRDIPGWSTVSVNDSSWEAATTYTLMDTRAITPDIAEPTGILGTVPAASVAPCSAGQGCYLVTMSELYTGWFSITNIPASAGATITIFYSTNQGTTVEYNMMDQVTLPAYPASFSNRFSYHEIQYITITGLTSPPRLESMTGLRLMNARPRYGTFACSNSLLTAIYNTTLRTYEGLTTGGMTVDCPHRERLGYGGDGHTSMELAMATYASGAFFAKVAQDWGDVQGWDGPSDGNLPHTAPTVDGGGGPGWGGFIVNMPWRLYIATGDAEPLRGAYPHMQRFLQALLFYVDSKSGLMQPFGGDWGFLGDWLTPHGSENSGTPESILFNNCYLVFCLRLAEKIAGVVGDASGAQSYAGAADKLAAAVHAGFFVNSTNSYLDTRQTHQVMPLVAGVVPAALRPAVFSALEKEIVVTQTGHLDTGLHGTYFMAKLLSDPSVERDDLLYLMASQTSAPSYGDMLAKGYTTWPEEWGGAPSRMHGCLNGFGLWFNQGLLGVRADEAFPGLRRVNVQPAYGVGDVSWAQGTTLTPYGTLANSWLVGSDGRSFNHTLTVPMNAGALLWLPANDPSHVSESGRPALSAPGVAFQGQDGNMTVWALGSGTYAFASFL